jgi:hypothetical protein
MGPYVAVAVKNMWGNLSTNVKSVTGGRGLDFVLWATVKRE